MKFGTGTDFKYVRAPSVEVLPPLPNQEKGYTRVRISAVIEVSFESTLVRGSEYTSCSVCGETAPMPNADGLRFLIENHDGDRLCFAMEGDCEDERDRYPVKGWERVSDWLTCASCAAELGKAREAIRAKKRGRA